MRNSLLPGALCLLGLVPFLAAALGTVMLPVFLKPVAIYAALVCGLAALAFAGGAQWGLARRDGGALRILWAALLPSIGVLALFAPRPIALAVLAAALTIAAVVDVAAPADSRAERSAALRLAFAAVAAATLAFTALEARDLRVDPFGTIARPG